MPDDRTTDPAKPTLHLARWTVTSGSNARSRGAVILDAGDHHWRASAEGNGAIDALYRAVDKALSEVLDGHPRLLAYDIHALGEGTDTIGAVTVRIAPPEATGARGRGEYDGAARGTNIIAASIEAYIVALNAMLDEAHWTGAPEGRRRDRQARPPKDARGRGRHRPRPAHRHRRGRRPARHDRLVRAVRARGRRVRRGGWTRGHDAHPAAAADHDAPDRVRRGAGCVRGGRGAGRVRGRATDGARELSVGLRGRGDWHRGRRRRPDRERDQRHGPRELRPPARARPGHPRRSRRAGSALPGRTPGSAPRGHRTGLLAHPGARPGRGVPPLAPLAAPVHVQHGRGGQGDRRPGELGAAAVLSPRAADLFGLEILADEIGDLPGNRTRFVVLGRTDDAAPPLQAPGTDQRTTIVVAVRNEPGTLLAVLQVIADHGLNMRKLESRPSRERAWEYVFWIDLDGDAADPPMAAALHVLDAVTTMTRVLGSYPSADA
ncbi:MAG: alpha-isopropylmalate synthase regulatory domain-containing protein [Candidatus Limnocylindrales bacterium]